MKIIDISVSFEEGMMKYPSLKPFERKWLRSFENGDQNQVSYIQSPSHNGTHLDAPCHYVKGGKTMDDFPLDRFCGLCQVIEVPDAMNSITKEFLETIKISTDKIIFKTSNSTKRMKEFCDDYVYIHYEAAQYLVEKGIKFVGIDYVSVDGKEAREKPTHMTLLQNEVIVLEDAYMENVKPGIYNLAAFPLKVTGAEGCFCRAVLITEE